MICAAIDGLTLGDSAFRCTATGAAESSAGVLAVVVAVVAFVWAGACARDRASVAGSCLCAVAALCLGVAAGLPEVRSIPAKMPVASVVVLLDASESVRRDGDLALDEARAQLAKQLSASIEALSEDSSDAWRGRLMRFGKSPKPVAGPVPIASLPAAIAEAEIDVAADETDIAGGLDAALDAVADEPGSGIVVLVSDGHATRGNLEATLARASGLGVPVHILPVGTEHPRLGLVDSNIGPDQAIGRPTKVRTTVLGDGLLRWNVNGGEIDHMSISDEADPRTNGSPVPRGASFHTTLTRRGLQFVTLEFGPTTTLQRAQLYTLVRGPARVLAYGDAPWLDEVDQRRFAIARRSPSDSVDLADYSAIVVDGLAPGDFVAGFADRALRTAEQGTGVMLVNGHLRGDRTEPQRIADWEKTALGPVLPVISDPVWLKSDPPRRDILILIDISGSMEGGGLAQAKAVVNRILDNLRPEAGDTIAMLGFSDRTTTRFTRVRATSAVVAQAREFLRGLSAGGGTDPTEAIAEANTLSGNHCGLFFVSDGEFPPPAVSPSCYTTAIAVAGGGYPAGFITFGEERRLGHGVVPEKVEFRYFEPEKREIFWLDGAMSPLDNGVRPDMVPGIAIPGLALSHARPEADVMSIHRDRSSPAPYPVLAFRTHPSNRSLTTAVHLGDIPAEWAAHEAGRRAAEAVLEALVAWKSPDRWNVDLAQDGDRFELTLTYLGEHPIPDGVDAAIRLENGISQSFRIEPHGERGVFRGEADILLGAIPQKARLILDERGPNDIVPPQHIPALLPARSAEEAGTRRIGSEALAFGIDAASLETIRARTGGLDLRESSPSLERSNRIPPPLPIWPWISAAALALFALSLFATKARR